MSSGTFGHASLAASTCCNARSNSSKEPSKQVSACFVFCEVLMSFKMLSASTLAPLVSPLFAGTAVALEAPMLAEQAGVDPEEAPNAAGAAVFFPAFSVPFRGSDVALGTDPKAAAAGGVGPTEVGGALRLAAPPPNRPPAVSFGEEGSGAVAKASPGACAGAACSISLSSFGAMLYFLQTFRYMVRSASLYFAIKVSISPTLPGLTFW
mmetsp:Transcript_81618/g.227303  ORF Transcript_81618/g.227303 Transcript_81618/m.227303 type:complete len:209 (-) Transcript_81618:154-780(-)